MGAIDGLRLDRRIPPWVEEEHVFSRRQVQTETTGLEADQKDAALLVCLEAVDSRFAVTGLAIEIFVGNTVSAETILHQREQTRELRKHQCLVPFVHGLSDAVNQKVKLGAASVG